MRRSGRDTKGLAFHWAKVLYHDCPMGCSSGGYPRFYRIFKPILRNHLVIMEPTSLYPILLALFSAFLFALGDQFQNQGLATVDSRVGAVLSIGVSTAFFLVLAPWLLDIERLLHPAVLIFVLVGLFRPGISVNLALVGMRYLGPTLATTLTSTSPFFATAMGVLWLGELITTEVALGTLVIVLAVMLMAKGGAAGGPAWPLWALAFPVGAAIIRSGGHVLSKLGMNEVPDPYLASLVTFAVSALTTIIIHRSRREAPSIVWGSVGSLWFMGAGLAFAVAILALNEALLHGTVVQVVPVVSAAPIFTMIMSIAVFQRERITARTVTVVFMVVPAIFLILLS
ncbi:DMT family transporter [Alphaproteobacteria bacterium]|nr:DMT family transporter [Alphaproteobacteria bacterium]